MFRMFKRVISLLLAMTMVISMVPGTARAATDYSDYTFCLESTGGSSGSCGALKAAVYYMEYQYWPHFESGYYTANNFSTRARFEQDARTGKYRIFYYVTTTEPSSLRCYKYYLKGATYTSSSSEENMGFYYSDTYGYKYVTLGSASEALLWEVTSSGYLKTTYNNQTHYLWSTLPKYDSLSYVLRLRTTTTATGSYGVPYSITKYGDLQDSSYHVHTPQSSMVTTVVPATCVAAERQIKAIVCKDTSCGKTIDSETTSSGSVDPSNHTNLTTRIANEQPANCQTPYTYEIETYCTGCNVVTETAGPYVEGELGDHVPGAAVIEKETAGTCASSGSYESAVYCSICQTELSRETVDTGLGSHTEVVDEAVEPGCTTTGLTEGRHCSVCDEVLIAQTVLDALGHTEVTDNAVAPSCTETGLTEGKHCSTCDEVLTAQRVLDALGHTEVTDAAVAPSCTETGLTEGKHCSTCDEVLVALTVVDVLGHSDVTDEAVAPSCTETGLTEGKHCSVCKEVLVVQTVVDALGHTEVIDAAEAPSCTETGLTEGKHCSVCDEVLVAQRVLEALGHTEVTDAAVAPTCTETGLTEGKHCSACDEVLVAQRVLEALGHTEVIDAGVEPTCTESGLTEGKHCSSCKEVLAVQTVLEPWGHDEIIDAAVAPTCTAPGLTEGKHCGRCGEVFTAQTEVPALGHTEVIDPAVEPTCAETGLTEGSHCSGCGHVFEAQEEIPAIGHDFADAVCRNCGEELVLKLAQEYLALDLDAGETALLLEVSPGDLAEDITWTVEGDPGILEIVGQGSVKPLAVGTAWVQVSATVGEATVSDRCRIDVTELETLEKNIQLSTNKLTTQLYSTDYASFEVLLKLPQNYPESMFAGTDAAQMQDQGAAVQSARFTNAATAKLFDLVARDDRTVAVVPTEYAITHPEALAKSYFSAVSVTIDGSDYTSEFMTLTVKKTLPKLKAKVPALNSFYPDQTQRITVTGGTVTGITLNPDKAQPNWVTLGEDGTVRLTENAPRKSVSGKLQLLVETEQWRIPAKVTLTVKNTYKEPKLKLSAKSLTMNLAAKDSTVVTITAAPADYDISELDFRLTDSTGKKDKTGDLCLDYENGTLTIRTTDKAKGNYKIHISTRGSKAVVLTVKTVSAIPTVTFKTKGNLDLNIPAQRSELIPAFKNYNGSFTVVGMTAETAKKQDISEQFSFVQENSGIRVFCEENTPVGTYTLKLELSLADGSVVTNTAKITVKQTALKLKLSVSRLKLNKQIGDKATVAVTSATRGYVLEEPDWKLMDSTGNNPAEDALSVAWRNGKLTVATNEKTAYGTTYKLLVRANKDAPAQTVTVTILESDKSSVASTLKAKGRIDVIREGSAVILTPVYKNCASGTEREEVLVFRQINGKQAVEVNDLFGYSANPDGSITVTQAEGKKLDHSKKYTVQMVTYMDGVQICTSKPITLPVKMGTAKLKLTAKDKALFAKDVHDRAVFHVSSTDLTVNAVSRVEIKDAKYKNLLEIHSYGNNEFAIGFKDGEVGSQLKGKTVTVNLNIFLNGNETAKANAVLKLKVTIVK